VKVITATESLHLKWQILYLFIMVKKINENTLNTELCILSAEMYSYVNYISINLLKQKKKNHVRFWGPERLGFEPWMGILPLWP
jgi:hypothetical protein